MIDPKAAMEFVGTAILVFTIQVSVGLGTDMAPLAIGLILVAIVFAGGPVSGAHYNPAVSLSIALRKGMAFHEMLVYWLSQTIGGIVGAILGGFVGSNFSVCGVGEKSNLFQALVAELVFTFILCFVVLCVATNSKVDNNHYYGLAIGIVVLSGAITAGPISGGAFNPAVALGLSIAGGFSSVGYGLMVTISNLLGGLVAAACFYVTVPGEFDYNTIGETTPLA